MKSISRPFASAVRSRTYATQTAAKNQTDRKSHLTPQDVKVTRLPSGVIVASLENYSPVSRVSVLYNAGPRYESPESLGITHCLRMASVLNTKKATGFAIAKNIQQIGGNLTCTTNREQMIYTVEALRSHIPTALDHLNHVATAPLFTPWDISDITPRLQLDLDVYRNSPEARLMEALHKGAYRDTLGQSLYMNSDRVGSFSPAALEAFVKSHYVSHNMAVVGLGIDHETLIQHARKFTVHQGSAPETKKAKYHSGEIRLDFKSPLVYAAIVTEGVGLGSTDLLPLNLLQLALGSEPSVKYSTNTASSKIGKAASAGTAHPFAASSISSSYSDSGLFGFQVITDPKDAGKVLKSVLGTMGQVTKNGITDADLQRAKHQFKAQMRMHGEDPACFLEWIGVETLLSGQVISMNQIDSAIDKLNLDDVNKVAKKVINGKPTMAAVGDLSKTPYLDEIMS